MHTETADQLVWILRLFEEKTQTTPKVHDLIAIAYVKTELQLRLAWCMTGVTMGEYDPDERKRSK